MGTKPVATPEAWRSRIVGHGEADPATLIANPRNWRTHPPEQRAALVAELDRVGFVQSVVVNRTTGLLVDGHLRVEVAVERRVPTIPVVYVELTEEEEQRVLVALDPLGSMAGTNDALLQALLAEVDLENQALEKHLVTFLAGGKGGRTEPDDVPAVPEGDAVYVKPGDLWVLGDHRLLCGDSTQGEDVDRLMGESLADCMWTDPPYGVDYQGNMTDDEAVARNRRRDQKIVANDKLTTDQLRAFLVSAFRNAARVMRRGAAYYVACPQGSFDGEDVHLTFRVAIAQAGLPIRETLVWVKDVFVMGRGDYHWRHEPILYGWKPGAAHYFVDDRTQDTVWNIERPKVSQDHPTMKPVALVERAIANSSRPGDLVYEPFAGSGSTVIAAETLGRRCYAMELEPEYVQVIVERWQAFTGREAVRG